VSSFWKQHNPEQYESKSKFISGDEFEELAARDAAIRICEVAGPSTSNFGEKLTIGFTIDGDDEIRRKSFKYLNDEFNKTDRDRLLLDIQEWLAENPAGDVPVKFRVYGNYHAIEPDIEAVCF
jgi:hypothetical protein